MKMGGLRQVNKPQAKWQEFVFQHCIFYQISKAEDSKIYILRRLNEIKNLFSIAVPVL